MIASGYFFSVFFFISGKRLKDDPDEDLGEQQWICRFVVDGHGRTIGESISLEDDIVIIKSKNTYLGVPLKHIEQQEQSLLVKGLIDYDKAIEMGEQWRKESLREFDAEAEDR